MPANFPEIWEGRVIQLLDDTDQAPFLEGIAEMPVNVTQINAGTLSEKNIIYVPTTEFEVDVLINNTTYPLDIQEYDDDTIQITLDKYQPKVVSINDDDTIGASYDKIDEITKNIRRAILVNKFKKAIHSIAPQERTEKTPVLETTGDDDGTGRKRLVYEDLVRLKDACDKALFSMDDRRLVLTPSHWNDLLLDRKNFGNQLVDYAKGKPAPMIADFELQRYQGNPHFDASLQKLPFGAIPTATDRAASVVFCKSAIAKKTGITKQYFVPATLNPRGQSNELSYRHYFVATPYRAEKIGAII